MSPVAAMAVSGYVLESGLENFLHQKKRQRENEADLWQEAE